MVETKGSHQWWKMEWKLSHPDISLASQVRYQAQSLALRGIQQSTVRLCRRVHIVRCESIACCSHPNLTTYSCRSWCLLCVLTPVWWPISTPFLNRSFCWLCCWRSNLSVGDENQSVARWWKCGCNPLDCSCTNIYVPYTLTHDLCTRCQSTPFSLIVMIYLSQHKPSDTRTRYCGNPQHVYPNRLAIFANPSLSNKW